MVNGTADTMSRKRLSRTDEKQGATMQPNYFEIAKSLMVSQGQQMLDRLKQTEAVIEPTLIQCANCKDHFPAEDIIQLDGLSFCSEECAIEHEASDVEFDNTCHVCQGTGEGQNDYCSCYACKGKGIVVSKERCEP